MSKPIVIDPEILGGTPVFAKTRVPVQSLIDYLEEGHTLEDFFADFPTVTRDQAAAALEEIKEAARIDQLEKEWGIEIEHRARRALTGESPGLPWTEVEHRIRGLLTER